MTSPGEAKPAPLKTPRRRSRVPPPNLYAVGKIPRSVLAATKADAPLLHKQIEAAPQLSLRLAGFFSDYWRADANERPRLIQDNGHLFPGGPNAGYMDADGKPVAAPTSFVFLEVQGHGTVWRAMLAAEWRSAGLVGDEAVTNPRDLIRWVVSAQQTACSLITTAMMYNLLPMNWAFAPDYADAAATETWADGMRDHKVEIDVINRATNAAATAAQRNQLTQGPPPCAPY